LAEIQQFEHLESEGAKQKIETLRKLPLKLSINGKWTAFK